LDHAIRIADGLEVSPAMAELERCADHWFALCPETRQIPLVGAGDSRLMEAQLPATWGLIDEVHRIARLRFGGVGRIIHARIGKLRPGGQVPPHRDGRDGVIERRYQIALQSEAGAELTVAGSAIRLRLGEAWWLDVSQLHSVRNNSRADRIVALFDTRI